MITKEDIKEQFSRTSEAYLTSKTHAEDIDLDILLLLLAPQKDMVVLDIATGAGYTALKIAPHVREVVASDLTQAMLDRVNELKAKRGIHNVTTVIADAESLPFGDGSFDAVTCRIAPHHFLDVAIAVAEVARVLRPGGAFILEDSISPATKELDVFINTLEHSRDHTHIRSYTLAEWSRFALDAGLTIKQSLIYRKQHDIADWVSRADISADDQLRVLDHFRSATAEAKEHYAITFDAGGSPLTYTDDKAILRIVRNS